MESINRFETNTANCATLLTSVNDLSAFFHTISSSLSHVSAIVVVLGLKSRADLMNIYEATLARAQGENRLNVRF